MMDAATISDIVMASVLGLLGVDRGRQIYQRRRNGNEQSGTSVSQEHCRDEHARLERDAAKRERWEADVSVKLEKIATDTAVLVALNEVKRDK